MEVFGKEIDDNRRALLNHIAHHILKRDNIKGSGSNGVDEEGRDDEEKRGEEKVMIGRGNEEKGGTRGGRGGGRGGLEK